MINLRMKVLMQSSFVIAIILSISLTVTSFERCIVEPICSTRSAIRSTDFCEYQQLDILEDTQYNIKIINLQQRNAFFRVDYRDIWRTWIETYLTLELTDNAAHCTTMTIVRHGWYTYQIQMNGVQLEETKFYYWSKIRILVRGHIELNMISCHDDEKTKTNNNGSIATPTPDHTVQKSQLSMCFSNNRICWFMKIMLIALVIALSLLLSVIIYRLLHRNRSMVQPKMTIGMIISKLNLNSNLHKREILKNEEC